MTLSISHHPAAVDLHTHEVLGHHILQQYQSLSIAQIHLSTQHSPCMSHEANSRPAALPPCHHCHPDATSSLQRIPFKLLADKGQHDDQTNWPVHPTNIPAPSLAATFPTNSLQSHTNIMIATGRADILPDSRTLWGPPDIPRIMSTVAWS